MQVSHHLKGFALIGVAIALTILATMAAGLAVLSATNQATRSQQLYMDQAFFSAHAALEYALRQIKVDGNVNPLPARDFSGSAFSLRRNTQKIWAITTKATATNSFSITDPNPPPQAACLDFDVSAANYRGDVKQLIGITLTKNVDMCPETIVMVGMIISWTPNGGEKVEQIQFNNNPQKEYHSPPRGSGSTFNFSTLFPIPDGTTNQLTDIQWKTSIDASSTFVLTFIMEDASTKTITVP